MGARLHTLFLVTALMQGCVTIDKENSKSLVIGIGSVENTKSLNSKLEEQTIFGAWLSQKETGLGYKREQKLILSSKCQVIFLVETPTEYESAIDLLNSTLELNKEQICVINKEKA